MIKIKITIVILITFNFFSCNGKNNVVSNKNYIIPDSIFDFFADTEEMTNSRLIYSSDNAEKTDGYYFSTEFVITHICKAYKIKDPEEIIKIESIYQSKSLNVINTNSNDYFIIGSQRDMNMKFDTALINKNYSKFHSINNIIPNFNEMIDLSSQLLSSKTLSGLADDYKVYILKSGSKFILPKKYKTEWSLLPKHIKHGYQSGLAISYNHTCVIYWAIAW